MSQEVPERGEPLDVTIEGQVANGVYRVDAGVEDLVLVTIHYGPAGVDWVPGLIKIVEDNWPAMHQSILEAERAGQEESDV